jgi:kojibiose phosphorylase
MGNTGKEGLHMANFGEVWQTVVFGFAGLRFSGGGPSLRPHLPRSWSRLAFRFFRHGRRYGAEVTQDGASLQEEG